MNAVKVLPNLVSIDSRHKIGDVDSRGTCLDTHRQFIAKGFGGAAAHPRQAEMLAGQRADDDVELFQRHDAIRLPGLCNMAHQIEEEFY